MVDNQEKDGKSQSLMKKQKYDLSEPVHEAGELKIWVNLQIPKNSEGFEEINKNQKICHVCNKGFLSGKALGGHMRIHSKQHELSNSDDHDVIVSLKDSSTCVECGKYFSSKKALSGHMRCHPDRGYRGIRPPPSMNETSSYLSSENDDDDESDDYDYQREVSDKEISAVALVESLKGWSATARRGRRVSTSASETSSSMEDDKLRGAADDLMMLARKGKIGNNQVSHMKVVQFDANGEEKGSNEVEKSSFVGESVDKLDGHDHHLIDEINGQLVVSNTLGEKMKANKRKRRVKVIKLADLDSTTPLDLDLKYKCNTCGKSFSTHQALGGHMSSHNKVIKFTIQNSVDKPVTVLSKVALQGEAREKCRIDFDLNVKLPSDDEDGFYQPQNVNFG